MSWWNCIHSTGAVSGPLICKLVAFWWLGFCFLFLSKVSDVKSYRKMQVMLDLQNEKRVFCFLQMLAFHSPSGGYSRITHGVHIVTSRSRWQTVNLEGSRGLKSALLLLARLLSTIIVTMRRIGLTYRLY